jgi:Xaa-Pro aminopeptidase
MAYIELIARLKYRHGTGHGVGHYLNVHEGMCRSANDINAHPLEKALRVLAYASVRNTWRFPPIRELTTKSAYNSTTLKPGMTMSNGKGTSQLRHDRRLFRTFTCASQQSRGTMPTVSGGCVSRAWSSFAKSRRPTTLGRTDTSALNASRWSVSRFV